MVIDSYKSSWLQKHAIEDADMKISGSSFISEQVIDIKKNAKIISSQCSNGCPALEAVVAKAKSNTLLTTQQVLTVKKYVKIISDQFNAK